MGHKTIYKKIDRDTHIQKWHDIGIKYTISKHEPVDSGDKLNFAP